MKTYRFYAGDSEDECSKGVESSDELVAAFESKSKAVNMWEFEEVNNRVALMNGYSKAFMNHFEYGYTHFLLMVKNNDQWKTVYQGDVQ
jgi:hypothetical protein